MIIQNGKPIAFYSRKLKGPKQRHTLTEEELLSIVETFKEFFTILLGQRINIYTDHKQLMWNNFNTDRVLRWRLILEEYGIYIDFIQGAKNIAEDVLSQLSNNGNQEITHESAYTMETMSELYDTKELPEGIFPIYFKLIYCYQQGDPILTEKLNHA